MSTDIGTWVAALLTLAAFSFIFKENRFSRAAEHIYVGVGAGYSIVLGYGNIKTSGWDPMVTKGQWQLLIPMILGVLLFARFLPNQVAWLSRLPMALVVGMGSAIALRGAVDQQFVKQIQATFIPLNTINNIIVVVGVVGVLSYFVFTKAGTNPVTKNASRVGRWVMMATFGAAFGNAVMGRISLFIGQLNFIFGDWLHIIAK